MSKNAAKPGLIQLIYSHLKEHGYHTAAEELQRHSPQEQTTSSASLQDIYGSWLCKSKHKKKSAGGKNSKKAKSTTPSKKKNKSSKKATKKGISEKSPKAIKAGDGEGSDSDSSLDVEKWKKRVLTMTEADVIKMESINALDSAAPQPPQKRVRKPRAKPQAKSGAAGGKGEKASNKEEEHTAATEVALKTGAQILTTPTKPATSQIQNQDSASTTSPLKQREVENGQLLPKSAETNRRKTRDTKKKTKKKKQEDESETKSTESVNKLLSDDGEGQDQERDELKDCADEAVVKKKTKASKRHRAEDLVSEIQRGDHLDDLVKKKKPKTKKTEKEQEETPAENVEERKVKKKKRGGGDEGNPQPLDQGVKEKGERLSDGKLEAKKEKKKKQRVDKEGIAKLPVEEECGEKLEVKKVKKKRRSAVCEQNPPQEREEVKDQTEPMVEKNPVSELTSETVAANKDEVSRNDQESPECAVTAKKAKKKKKKSEHESGEGTSGRKRDAAQHNAAEETAELNDSLANASQGNLQENGETTTESVSEVKKKKKRKNRSEEPEPPSDVDTPSPPAEKRKKKKKLQPLDVPLFSAASNQELPAAEADSGSRSKKKMKPSKRIES